jgi:flagellar basal-body rod protein FlgG
MNSGMYAALSGNIASQVRLDVLTNNLANSTTAGFKKDAVLFDSLLTDVKNPTSPAGTMTDAPVLSQARFVTDFSAGPVRRTDNVLDLALDGDGFFTVNTPDGPAYTRQGTFHLNAANRLVTADGYEVLAGGSPLTLQGGNIDVNPEGEVMVDGVRMASLDLVDFPRPYQLQKVGSALFMPVNGEAPERPAVRPVVQQGFIEDSNVNTILEMARLIETTRYFESCQKVVRSYDEMSAKAASEMGRV